MNNCKIQGYLLTYWGNYIITQNNYPKPIMPFTIQWNTKSVQIIYYGDINNEEIKSAHYDVNNDERFFDCHSLILDITDCNMKDVHVSELTPIVGLDLGNLKTKDYLKIAMIANCPANQLKAQAYIKHFKQFSKKIQLFSSTEEALPWLNSED